MAEIWDLYDSEGRLTGKTMKRGEGIEEGYFHKVVHLCLFNSKQELLCQKRSIHKDGMPGYWDLTVGGSVISGENENSAMTRELQEELGIYFDFSQVTPFFYIKSDYLLDYYFFLIADFDLNLLTLQPEEVDEVSFYDLNTVKEMMKNDKFICYNYLDTIEEIKDNLFHNKEQ